MKEDKNKVIIQRVIDSLKKSGVNVVSDSADTYLELVDFLKRTNPIEKLKWYNLQNFINLD